jgi:transposase
MGVNIFLNPKEARRLHVIEQAIAGKLTNAQAATILHLSVRQVKRLKKGVKAQGAAFLVHKNRGRRPKHAIPNEVRDLVISLALGKYRNASAQQLAEFLAEDYNLTVSARSIARILKAAGIPLKHAKKQPKRHRSRDRMPAAGMLVQCDASPFAWFEDRGPMATLHGIIDDATGMILALFFRPTEDLLGYLVVLLKMLLAFGIPKALYSDRHTIFFSPKKDKLSIEDELAGKKVKLTQFGRVLNELGIEHIPALSPQAKGRIERLWGTLQDRLVLELRRAGISSIEEANAFLPSFIEKFNARFAKPPANPEPAFAPCPPRETLEHIICVKETRKASAGSTISFGGKTYQLLTPAGTVLPLAPRDTVEVLSHLDGSLSALYKGNHYRLRELLAANTPKPKELPKSPPAPRKPYSPPPTHPWRRPIKTRKRRAGPTPYEGFWEDVHAAR